MLQYIQNILKTTSKSLIVTDMFCQLYWTLLSIGKSYPAATSSYAWHAFELLMHRTISNIYKIKSRQYIEVF